MTSFPTTRTTPRTRKVHGTYQIAAILDDTQIADIEQRFNKARVLVLKWMNERHKRELGYDLPLSAWGGEGFEVDKPGQLYAGMDLADLALWTCRLEHQDNKVAARTWTVDLTLQRKGTSVILLERTLCTSPSDCGELAPLTVPRIIRDLAGQVGLKDALQISDNSWSLRDSNDLELLQLALEDSQRTLPVVILTQTEPRGRDQAGSYFPLDPSKMASSLFGLAHVVAMPHQLGFEWTNRIGKSWSVFNGAVRTYRPRLDFSKDDPYRHPLVRLNDIVLWEYEGVLAPQKVSGGDAFQLLLREKLFHEVASRPFRHDETPFYPYAKMQALSTKAADGNTASLLEALTLERDELKKQVEEERGEKNSVWDELAKQEEAVQALEKERHKLRAQLESFRAGLGKEVRTNIPIPRSLEALDEWQANVGGQLVLTSKAVRHAAKSDFRDPKLVYESLLLLAIEYRQMRIVGGDELRLAYENGLKSLKLTESRSISEARKGEQGEEYYVNHPLNPSRRIFLEDHLRKGNDRDQRNTLRIYFTWDHQEQLVVVGWLPSHLDTRNS